jgi:hypothetical protein
VRVGSAIERSPFFINHRYVTAAFLLKRIMIGRVLASLRNRYEQTRLPQLAREETIRDRRGLSSFDPGIAHAVESSIRWLLLAQSCSASADGGVARHLSLINGWAPSYPETTGYILPTVLDWGEQHADKLCLESARNMADWLLAIQFPEGGFQGGKVDAEPRVPVTFNTGQILIGLARAAQKWGGVYRDAMNRAATWLVETQDPDGCWRRHPTPFAAPGDKAYETHVAWGLFEAARIDPDERYGEAGLANVRWALRKQRENGWIEDCCLNDSAQPLTHTLGYFLRGVLEANRFHPAPELVAAALKTARGLLKACSPDGFLPGRVDRHFSGTVPWACLTGSVQLAHCFLMLYQEMGDLELRDAAFALNGFVRRTVRVDGPEELVGGVKGAFPVWGDYGRYEFLNWSAKFFIDSNQLEERIQTLE